MVRAIPDDVPRETPLVVGVISGSQFVNHTYLVVFPPVLGVLTEEFGVTLAALGVVLGVQGATNTAFQLPFGHLADTRDRSIALALSSFVGAAGVLGVAAAPTYEWLVVAAGLVGVGVAGHHPAHYPLLSDATPEAHRGRAFSVYGFGGSLGFAASPAFITAVLAIPGLTWRHAVGAIGLFGLGYAVVATAVVHRRVSEDVTAPNRESGDARGGLRDRVRAQLRALAAAPGILALAVLALVTSVSSWGFTSYVTVLLTDGYGVSLTTANLTLTAIFAAGAVAILLGGDLSDRLSAGPVLVGSYAVLVVLLALVAAGVLPPLAAVGLAILIGAVRSLSAPARSKLADRLSAGGTVGRNFAVISVGIMLGSAIAPPLFGFLIDARGVTTAFLGVAAGALLAFVVAVAGLFAGDRAGTSSAAGD
jgi:MFS family permease